MIPDGPKEQRSRSGVKNRKGGKCQEDWPARKRRRSQARARASRRRFVHLCLFDVWAAFIYRSGAAESSESAAAEAGRPVKRRETEREKSVEEKILQERKADQNVLVSSLKTVAVKGRITFQVLLTFLTPARGKAQIKK